MRVIWKEKLDWGNGEKQLVMLPAPAEILHVNFQEGDLTFWFLTDPDSNVREGRWFQIFGTGHPDIPVGSKYLHTFFKGWLVLHLFELPYEEDAARA